VTIVGSIPAAPRFILERDFLAQVVCQVRFSPLLRLRETEGVVAFQESVRSGYPRYEKQAGIHLIVTPNGVMQQENPDPVHRFRDTEGVYTALLSTSFVALETRRYRGIDEFAPRLVELAQAVNTHYGPAEMTRIGLRFVNEIRLPGISPGDAWARALTPAMLGPLATEELKDAVSATQQVIELHTDSNRILVRHGYLPQGTTVDLSPGEEPPRDQNQPFYLLDIDAYAEENMPYSTETISARLTDFNDQIRGLFAWAVPEEFRNKDLGQRLL
jgi:uncharacterized protein (TIGR04255 family)